MMPRLSELESESLSSLSDEEPVVFVVRGVYRPSACSLRPGSPYQGY
jgi:hypothetical protein